MQKDLEEKIMTFRIENRFRVGILLPILVAASSVCASAQTAQGTISGIVYGPDGKALGGTSVWANLVSAPPRPVDRSAAGSEIPPTAVTAGDGSFKLLQVPVGDYALCANHTGVPALNPCVWGGALPVHIASGVSSSGQAIRMAAGAPLQVHLDDPGGLLAANLGQAPGVVSPIVAATSLTPSIGGNQGQTPGASLMVGVATQHGFLPLVLTGSSAISRDYQLLVPFNITNNLLISTSYLKVTNAAGVTVAGQTIPVSFSPGTPANVINFQVVGAGN
jgi:hypothetical protein